jgi:hypothetical protein
VEQVEQREMGIVGNRKRGKREGVRRRDGKGGRGERQ